MTKTKHPAKFTDSILDVIKDSSYLSKNWLILDPFAGTGRVHEISAKTVGVEIEPEWANLHPKTIVGDALQLPFQSGSFDAVVTSPVYGNRLSDHHNAKDSSSRRSYTHDLRASTGDESRSLHPNNSGTLQWGEEYRIFHERAWRESKRVLKYGGIFVLNVKNHVRSGAIQPVSEWHFATFMRLGYFLVDHIKVPVKGMGFGENRDKRVDYESVFVFRDERCEIRYS